MKILEDILTTEIDPAFAERAKLILNYIEKYKPKTILDVGCGRGFYLKMISHYQFIKEIHGVDIEKKYLKIAKKINNDDRVLIKENSVYSLPYPDNFFDFIICSEVLEHLRNDIKALKEIKRVLKPKGHLVITVPNYHFPFLWDPLNWLLMKLFNTHINKNIWWLAGIWADHERLYSFKKIKKILLMEKFRIKKTDFKIRLCWPFSHFILYGIGKNIVERLNINQLDRFYVKKNKPIAKILSFIFKIPLFFENKRNISTTSTNIIVLCEKKKN